MSDIEIIYSCDYCPNSKFSAKNSLKRHYTKVHKLNQGQLMLTSYPSLPDGKKLDSTERECPYCNQMVKGRIDHHKETCKDKPAASSNAPIVATSSRSERYKETVPASPTKEGPPSIRKDLTQEFASWLASKSFQQKNIQSRHTITLYVTLLQKLVSSFATSDSTPSRPLCNVANIKKTFALLSDHVFATRNDNSKRLHFLQSENQLYRAHLCNSKMMDFLKEKFNVEIKIFNATGESDPFDLQLSDFEQDMEVDAGLVADSQATTEVEAEPVSMSSEANQIDFPITPDTFTFEHDIKSEVKVEESDESD